MNWGLEDFCEPNSETLTSVAREPVGLVDSPEYLDEELNFTKTPLRKNGYSLKIISKIFANNRNRTSSSNIRPQSDDYE